MMSVSSPEPPKISPVKAVLSPFASLSTVTVSLPTPMLTIASVLPRRVRLSSPTSPLITVKLSLVSVTSRRELIPIVAVVAVLTIAVVDELSPVSNESRPLAWKVLTEPSARKSSSKSVTFSSVEEAIA